jgi:hypothetical protein
MNTLKIYRHQAAAILITALAVLAAGCGDDSAEALSKDDYVAQANAICAVTSEVVNAEFENFFATEFSDLGPETPEQAQTVFDAMNTMFDDVITPQIEDQLSELRELAAPEEDAKALADLYDDFEGAIAEYNTTLDDAVGGDETAMEAIGGGSAETVYADVDQRARDYGLSVCGEEDE